MKPVTVFTGQN